MHRRSIHLLATALIALVSLLAPLKAAFACDMMERVSEQCCCEAHPSAECEQAGQAGECCDVLSLPEGKANTLTTSAHSIGVAQLDDGGDLPPALPPREVIPDPPALVATTLADPFSYPLPWLHGSDTYLVTLRLRN